MQQQSTRDVIHSDSCGPFRRQRGSFQYLQGFVDEYSRHAIVFRRASTDAAGSLVNLREIDIKLFNRTGKHIKVFRVDNGPEYDNQLIRTYCKENGIKIQFSLPYCHNNATAERFWRTLMEGAMTQVHQSNLPRDFLFEAAMHFNYTRNNIPESTTWYQ